MKYVILKANITGVKVKFEQKEADSFNQDEQNRIINLIKTLDKSHNFTANRNSLILKILLFHGVRINELINLQWIHTREEYDEVDGCVYRFQYMGKGAKERSLDFPIAFVETNLDIIKKHVVSNYIVPSSSGEAMSQGSVYKMVKNLLQKIGITR